MSRLLSQQAERVVRARRMRTSDIGFMGSGLGFEYFMIIMGNQQPAAGYLS